MASMGRSSRNSKQKKIKKCQGFLDQILSWSLSDLCNEHLHESKVDEVPMTFSSTPQYMNSFKYLLLEETRADLLSKLTGISQEPASPISGLQRIPAGNHKENLYNMSFNWNKYEPRVGDLVALTRVKPKCIDNLGCSNNFFLTAYVTKVIDEKPMTVKICSSDLNEHNPFEIEERLEGFVVYLTSLTTNMRIWEALNSTANMHIIQRTLSFTPAVARDCDKCFVYGEKDIIDLKLRQTIDSFKLNTSQEAAVFSCLSAKKCCRQNSVTSCLKCKMDKS
ncbi:uncharacterized protein LOC143629638 [Bidens hawaiensis]|uniref:uncharacterized protein LOC143629638 n=1 Tax=Bidens hawaiensis TaxID=980011 RepID=UPI00404A4D91